MKAKLFCLIVLALSQGAPAATTGNTPGPHISFSETSFNFQKVQPLDKLQHDFIFTNVGDAVLEITAVQPICGCTTAGNWDRRIPPGKTGKIPLQFNPANFSGPISKGATVTCNDPGQRTVYLQFQASVWQPIEAQPRYVYFLPIEDELANETKAIRIVSNEEEPVTLEAVRTSNPVFLTELKTLRPGKEFELRVTCSGLLSNASPQGTITIKTSSTNLPRLTVNAAIMPQPAIVALPQQIQWPAGLLDRNYRFPVMIRNNSRAPLSLSEPVVNVEGATVEIQQVEPGKAFKLNLGLPPGFHARPGHSLELVVRTSHPKYPVFKVPIFQAAEVLAPAGSSQPGLGAAASHAGDSAAQPAN